MKTKSIYIFFIIFSIISAFKNDTNQQEPTGEISKYINEAKEYLKPFEYASSDIIQIPYKKTAWTKEVEVPLYLDEIYRFVFNKGALPLDIEITIYKKGPDAKDRIKLFSSANFPKDEKLLSWEPTEVGKRVFINYKIPATTESDKKGVLIFVLGYLL